MPINTLILEVVTWRKEHNHFYFTIILLKVFSLSTIFHNDRFYLDRKVVSEIHISEATSIFTIIQAALDSYGEA